MNVTDPDLRMSQKLFVNVSKPFKIAQNQSEKELKK